MNINQAFHKALVARIDKRSVWVRNSGLSKSVAYDLLKTPDYNFTLVTAVGCAQGLGISFQTLYQEAKRILEAEKGE